MQMPDRSGKPEIRTIKASVFRQRPEAMAFITEYGLDLDFILG